MPDQTPHDSQQHERRVTTILKQARREVGVRDLVTFSIGRMWTVLLALGSVVYALFGKSQARQTDKQSDSIGPEK